jgi:tyrosine-protein phosphatase SIW14
MGQCPLVPKDLTLRDDEELIAPENFSQVSPSLYRSSFPAPKHFPFLRTLGLKSVLFVFLNLHYFLQLIWYIDLRTKYSTLVLDDYPAENAEFLQAEGIKYVLPSHKSCAHASTDGRVV